MADRLVWFESQMKNPGFSGLVFLSLVFCVTMIGAFFVPAFCYSRYVHRTKIGDRVPKSSLLIGGGGIFLAGVLSIFQMPPEFFASTFSNSHLRDVGLLGINAVAYVFIAKLLLLPGVGWLGAEAARRSAASR